MVWWLRLCVSIAECTGVVLVWGTKIPHAAWYSLKKKQNLGSSASWGFGWVHILVHGFKS